MGRLANEYSRRLKSAAHAAFDPIWKSGYMSRTDAYVWLQRVTGLTSEEAHMGHMDDRMLRGVALVARAFCEDNGLTA